MADNENKNNDVDRRVDKLETKFEMYMKAQDERFNSYMQRQNELATDIRELRQDMKDMQKNFDEKIDNINAKMDAKIDKLDAKIDGMVKHVQTLSVAAVAGVGGMFVAVGVMVGTLIYSILTR